MSCREGFGPPKKFAVPPSNVCLSVTLYIVAKRYILYSQATVGYLRCIGYT